MNEPTRVIVEQLAPVCAQHIWELPCMLGRDNLGAGTEAAALVSRQHARLTWDQEHAVIRVRDLGSANGTRIDGQTILEAPWMTGSELEIAGFRFHWRPEVPEPVATSHSPTLPDLQEVLERLRQEPELRENRTLGADDILARIRPWLPPEIPEGDLTAYAAELHDDLIGFGPLERWLRDPEVDEILVNGPAEIYIERKGRLEVSESSFRDPTHLQRVIERLLRPSGRGVTTRHPCADARLPDGSRIHVAIEPVALNGPYVTIRKFRNAPWNWEAWLGDASGEATWLARLRAAVQARRNIVISGGTGTGKTTLLGLLATEIPRQERVVTIEDAAELQLQHPHVVRLEARPAAVDGLGAIPIRELLRNALRMRPDRLVIGECRGSEAFDMLQAMNTGHDGSLTTLHANTANDALARLESLVMMAESGLPLAAVRQQISSALDTIVQLVREPDGARRIRSISDVHNLTPTLEYELRTWPEFEDT